MAEGDAARYGQPGELPRLQPASAGNCRLSRGKGAAWAAGLGAGASPPPLPRNGRGRESGGEGVASSGGTAVRRAAEGVPAPRLVGREGGRTATSRLFRAGSRAGEGGRSAWSWPGAGAASSPGPSAAGSGVWRPAGVAGECGEQAGG